SARQAAHAPLASRSGRGGLSTFRHADHRQGSLRLLALVVLVVAAPPDARLVAPPGCAVEPLVHAPEAVHSARIRGISVVDDAVLERERAHAGPLTRVRGLVGSTHGGEGNSSFASS